MILALIPLVETRRVASLRLLLGPLRLLLIPTPSEVKVVPPTRIVRLTVGVVLNTADGLEVVGTHVIQVPRTTLRATYRRCRSHSVHRVHRNN